MFIFLALDFWIFIAIRMEIDLSVCNASYVRISTKQWQILHLEFKQDTNSVIFKICVYCLVFLCLIPAVPSVIRGCMRANFFSPFIRLASTFFFISFLLLFWFFFHLKKACHLNSDIFMLIALFRLSSTHLPRIYCARDFRDSDSFLLVQSILIMI